MSPPSSGMKDNPRKRPVRRMQQASIFFFGKVLETFHPLEV
jgi:hypothetical protein